MNLKSISETFYQMTLNKIDEILKEKMLYFNIKMYFIICMLHVYICTFFYFDLFSPFRLYILLSNNLPSGPLPTNQHVCYLLS